jgi:hypothetical protein
MSIQSKMYSVNISKKQPHRVFITHKDLATMLLRGSPYCCLQIGVMAVGMGHKLCPSKVYNIWRLTLNHLCGTDPLLESLVAWSVQPSHAPMAEPGTSFSAVDSLYGASSLRVGYCGLRHVILENISGQETNVSYSAVSTSYRSFSAGPIVYLTREETFSASYAHKGSF